MKNQLLAEKMKAVPRPLPDAERNHLISPGPLKFGSTSDEKQRMAKGLDPCFKTIEQEALLRAGITLAITLMDCK